MQKKGLGRWHSPDERDENHPLRAALGDESLPRYKYWRTGPVLDQGRSSSCVGQSWRQFLSSSPLMTKTGPDAYLIYRECQTLYDEWPGSEPAYYGTSVRAGAKCLTTRGHLSEYLWSWDADEVMRFVLTRGTVILGTDWHRAMFSPGPDGFIRPEGPVEGGHAYLCSGANRERGVFRITNSWGTGYGQNGRVWISGEDLQKLLGAGGEACSAVELGKAA
jgi:hypothetical protein